MRINARCVRRVQLRVQLNEIKQNTGLLPAWLRLVQNESDRKVNLRYALAVLPLLALLGCSATLPAPDNSHLSPPHLSAIDEKALTAAYQLIHFDLLECHEVQNNSDDKAVLAVAAKLCADATGYEPGLQNLARAHEVPLPNSLPDDLFARYTALHYATNPNADIQYLNDQIDSHENALAVFEEEVSRGENPELIGDSQAVIPVVQRNLSLLQRTLQSKG